MPGYFHQYRDPYGLFTEMTLDPAAGDSPTMAIVRSALLAILLFGMVGTLAELFLLEHVDGFWQLVPVVLLSAGTAVTAAHAWQRSHRGTIRVMQAVMVVFVVSGVAGMILHYLGNAEFEREMAPGASGFVLIREALMGATPALAPGAMIQLGLMGLASTFRHPASRGQ